MKQLLAFLMLSSLLFINQIVQAISDEARLMNWAEKEYPTLFSPPEQSMQNIVIDDPQNPFVGTWVYRFYPNTQAYIAIKTEGDVLVLSAIFGELPQKVGTLAELIKQVPDETTDPNEIDPTAVKKCVDIPIPSQNNTVTYQVTGNLNRLAKSALLNLQGNTATVTERWQISDFKHWQWSTQIVSNQNENITFTTTDQFEIIDKFRYRSQWLETQDQRSADYTYAKAYRAMPIGTFCEKQTWSSNPIQEKGVFSGVAEQPAETGEILGTINAIDALIQNQKVVKMTIKRSNNEIEQRWISINSGIIIQQILTDANGVEILNKKLK